MYNDDAGNGISYSQLLAFFCFILLFGLLFVVVVVVFFFLLFIYLQRFVEVNWERL